MPRVAPWGVLRRDLERRGFRVNLWANPPLDERERVELHGDLQGQSGHLCRAGQLTRAGNWIAWEVDSIGRPVT